jgi:hypothetical protein
MRNNDHTRQVYEDLAHWYERQGQAKLRDWFLVLAADTALRAGRAEEAERLRGRLLHGNPHHLLRPFDSFADALKSPDVQGYVTDLRRIYPPEAAEQLLQEQRQQAGEPAPPAKPARPLSAPLGVAADRDEAEVQVFRLEAGLEEPRPAPPPPPRTAAPRPALKPPAATPPPAPVERPPRPAPLPSPLPRVPGPTPSPWTVPPTAPADLDAPLDEEATDATSVWVSRMLFWLLLVGGLALAGYVLVRPLLSDRLF